MKSIPHKSSAFSLIELLVSVTIILLMVGGAIVGYTNYTEKQRLVAATEKLQSGFREAQNMARIGSLGNCAELDYIDFAFYIDGGNDYLTYRTTIYCANGDSEILPYVNIDEDLSLSADVWQIKFYPYDNLTLGNPPQTNISTTLSSTRSTHQAIISIDQGGSIKVTYN
jgi:type II secretory pathway pseudopilin PulG